MPDTTNAALAAKIRELSEKATAGEWKVGAVGKRVGRTIWRGDLPANTNWTRVAANVHNEADAELIVTLRSNAIVLAEALEATAKLAALLHEYHGRMHGADHRCARVAGECEAQDAIDQYFKETP